MMQVKPMPKVLITGVTGFIGRSLLDQLEKENSFDVTGLCRSSSSIILKNSKLKVVGSLEQVSNWSEIFSEQDAVIHTAARTHIMRDEAADSLAEYRKVNVVGSENLARQAAKFGVKRFIFLSSIKVCGEGGTHNIKYNEDMIAAPEDAYGQSKYEAEEVLKKVALETGMELVIIRSPLVYGSGVKANFLNLMRLASKNFPLPFGLIHNQRSMIYVENLVDFIIHCIEQPKAANETFLISDGDDISLSRLIKLIRFSMGRPSMLLSIPVWLFKVVGSLTRKRGVVDRLVGDLRVDSSKAKKLLDWKPPFTVEQGIDKTVKAFLETKYDA